MSLATWDKITGALGSTTSAFGGNWGNLVSDFFNGVDVGISDPTKLPKINTLTRFKHEKFALFDSNESHHVLFSVNDIDSGTTRKITIRAMLTPFETDHMVLEGMPQTILNKIINADLNTITNIENADIKTGAAIAVAKLSTGSEGYIIKTVGGIPTWVNANSGGNGGTAIFSGNASTTVFTIPHNMGGIPTGVSVEPSSIDALGDYQVDKDATNITITYQVAPPTGTNNVVFEWAAIIGAIENVAVAKGNALKSGNASTTVFTIPHGMISTPSSAWVEPSSTDALGTHRVDIDATNLIITYTTAPPTGTDNLEYYWGALSPTGGLIGTGEANTMSNVGAGTGLIFKQKTAFNLELKSLLQGTDIALTNGTSDITIAAGANVLNTTNVKTVSGKSFSDSIDFTNNTTGIKFMGGSAITFTSDGRVNMHFKFFKDFKIESGGYVFDSTTAGNAYLINAGTVTGGTGDATLKLPDMTFATTDRFVAANTVQTLTNKTIGDIKETWVDKSAAYTMTDTDHGITLSGTGTYTVTLPAVSGRTGRIYRFKKTGATGTVTLDGNASETIDGATTKAINTQWQTMKILCTGTEWLIVSN